MNRTYIQRAHLWHGEVRFQQYVRHGVGDVSLKYAMMGGGIYDDFAKKYGPIIVNEYGGWKRAVKRYTYEHTSRATFSPDDILSYPAMVRCTKRVNKAVQRRKLRLKSKELHSSLDKMLTLTREMSSILKKGDKKVAG